MDVSTFGTQFSKQIYTSSVKTDIGDLVVQSNNGKLMLQSNESIEIGSISTIVTGDLIVKGKLHEAAHSIDSMEGNSLTIHGDSILQGALDVNKSLDVNGTLDLGSHLRMVNGNLQMSLNTNLNGTTSPHYIILGDGNEGSWRIAQNSKWS